MKYLVEFDASGQEARFMAEFSQDEAMLRIFQNDEDFHSNTGSAISDIPYAEFMERKAAKDPIIVGEHGLRYCGKFVGLSSQYRVGAKKARIVARVQYGLNENIFTIRNWQKAYHRAYPGVKRYWGAAIHRAKEAGYAETLAGRRFGIHSWSGDDQWGSESSAINFPIQGSGADMKELAIAIMHAKHPEFVFTYDLHDGLFYVLDVKTEDQARALILKARTTLDNLPYKSAWGWTPSIKFPWDAAFGTDWGHMEELK